MTTSPNTRERRLEIILTRAIDAMSRTGDDVLTDDEWDAIIADGLNVLGQSNG